MGKHKSMHMVSFILLVVGGLNWLIYGIWGTDVGAWIGGMMTTQARVIYILVGLAAIYEIATHKGRCKECDAMAGGKSMGSGGGDMKM